MFEGDMTKDAFDEVEDMSSKAEKMKVPNCEIFAVTPRSIAMPRDIIAKISQLGTCGF